MQEERSLDQNFSIRCALMIPIEPTPHAFQTKIAIPVFYLTLMDPISATIISHPPASLMVQSFWIMIEDMMSLVRRITFNKCSRISVFTARSPRTLRESTRMSYICSEQYMLSHTQQTISLIHAYDGSLHRFFLNYCLEKNNMTFLEMVLTI